MLEKSFYVAKFSSFYYNVESRFSSGNVPLGKVDVVRSKVLEKSENFAAKP